MKSIDSNLFREIIVDQGARFLSSSFYDGITTDTYIGILPGKAVVMYFGDEFISQDVALLYLRDLNMIDIADILPFA